MRPAPPVHHAILAGLVLSILAAGVVRPALGAARVEGGVDAIRVEARDATLAEVFAALSARVGLRFRLSTATDQRVDGRFQGPLQRVVARLLAGRDYVARYSKGAVEILVLGPSGPAPTAAPTTAATAALADRPSPALTLARHGRRTRNEAALAAVRASQRTTGAGGGEASGPPGRSGR
jgi:hypothetical protein